MAVALASTQAVKVLIAAGVPVDVEFTRRAAMALLGAFLAFTGNRIPKTLTPLSALACDAARMQALQRLSGWAWVLSGAAFAVVWLVFPIALAKPVSLALIVGATLIVVLHIARLHLTRPARA